MSQAVSLDSRYGMAAQLRAGYGLVILVFVLIFVWGGFAPISGAVLATGRVSVESSVKRVQHKEGGIVSEILVKEGDHVQAGQVLARLDGTVADANDSVISGQLYQLQARKWRLEAERDRHGDMAVPADLASNTQLAPIIAAERRLMVSRRQMREQKKAQLREQIQQSQQDVDGLTAQIQALVRQDALIQQELKSVKDLYAKGYAPLTRVSELERESERLNGQKGQLESSIAQSNTQVSAIKLQILQVDSEADGEVMNDLKDTDTRLGQLEQEHITSQDAMQRIEIRAPVAGTVQQMTIHTKGGVVAPGETLMIIVPEHDDLVVEARIDPRRIDQVAKGGVAHIRFTAFDTRTTPEATGHVDSLSGDVETDEKSGASYYRARLLLRSSDLPKAIQGRIVAGMPVEVQIHTQSRNALSYFLKPLSDQMLRTFREQ